MSEQEKISGSPGALADDTREKGALQSQTEQTLQHHPTGDNGEHHFHLEHVDTYQTTYEQAFQIYDDEGKLILVPAPSRDPKDPLNLSFARKVTAMFFLSFFGALVASAEIILGACLPVFAIQYSPFLDSESDRNPGRLIQTLTNTIGGFPEHPNPLSYLNQLHGESIFNIYMLAAAPILVIGVSNLFFVPLAIAVGRRPVLLFTSLVAIAGACWAGSSTSFGSHLGARCVQALGAGTVESLIPFIIQDMVHVHERNTWISLAFAAQGLIIIGVGFATTYIIIDLSWHWVYYITAACAGFFVLGIFLFLPETRYHRTRAEMDGIPRDDANVVYEPRSFLRDLNPFPGAVEWRKGFTAFLDTLRTFFYPQILFVTLLNSVTIATAFAASLTAAPALLTQPWSWPFKHLGFSLVAVLIGGIAMAIIQGPVGDYLANLLAKKTGRRSPENQLINLFLPVTCGLLGALLFGLAGNDHETYGWPVFLTSFAFIAYGFFGTSATTSVYVLECYPYLAGPALVSIASFRYIIAFLLTFESSNWVVDMGYLDTFIIYVALIGAFIFFLPVVYFFGPAWRKRWGNKGRV